MQTQTIEDTATTFRIRETDFMKPWILIEEARSLRLKRHTRRGPHWGSYAVRRWAAIGFLYEMCGFEPIAPRIMEKLIDPDYSYRIFAEENGREYVEVPEDEGVAS